MPLGTCYFDNVQTHTCTHKLLGQFSSSHSTINMVRRVFRANNVDALISIPRKRERKAEKI